MSNDKWVCFACRLVYNHKHRTCSRCGGELSAIGKFFKAPKRPDTKQWEAVKILYDAGLRYDSSMGKSHETIFDEYDTRKEEFTQKELLRVLERSSWHYYCYANKWISGERPRHPRKAREFLQHIESHKQRLLRIFHEVADRLGRNHPEVKRLRSRIEVIPPEHD